jgi:hypothetical protein
MKIMNFKIAATLLLLTISMSSMAQTYTFRVLVNKGKNEVKSTTGWAAIKVGASLQATEVLKVSENSYLGLVHVTGKPYEVKKAGNYKVADLAKEVGSGSSVVTKYTDFILSSNSAEAKRNTQVATGAVHRGSDKIKIYLPESQMAIVYGSRITLNWDDSKIKGPYVVTLSSMFGDELAKIETKENTTTVDLSEKGFKNEDNIIVQVLPVSGEISSSEPGLMIKKMSKADRERIKPTISEATGSLKEDTALDKLLLAGAFEQNKLLIDAITAYQDAIKLAPDVDNYKELYKDFLTRNGLLTKE